MTDVPLIVCVKNGIFYIPFFLAHYRALGVTRFIVLDDVSSDGTRQALQAEVDVDLYASGLDYTSAGRGTIWRDALIDRYGRGRWYLSVDIDEFLIYPDCERRPVPSFVADLERAELRRCLAPMLDLYPDGQLSSATILPISRPTDVAPLIDGAGYSVQNRKFCTSINGGPRRRLFENEIRLTKFPVLFADEATRYHGGSIHGPLPFRRNFASASAVLLHFKFSPHSVAEFNDIVARGTHFDRARFYRLIIENDGFGPASDLRYDGSVRVGDSRNLVRLGFMEDLRQRS